MRNSQNLSVTPSGATSPFRRGKTEVAPTEHYNAIAGKAYTKKEKLSAPLKDALRVLKISACCDIIKKANLYTKD